MRLTRLVVLLEVLILVTGCTLDRPGVALSDSGPQADASQDMDTGMSDSMPPDNCGNGDIDGDEQCDDSNDAPGDGCDDACAIEPAHECPNPGAMCQLVTGVERSGPDYAADTIGVSNTGDVFDGDDCSENDAAIGVTGRVSSCTLSPPGLSEVRLLCARITGFDTTTGDATWAPTNPTAQRGICDEGSMGSVTCPPGTVLVGLNGRTSEPTGSERYIEELTLHCAPLFHLGGTLQRGPATPGQVLGSGMFDIGHTLCPSGQVGAGVRGTSGLVLDTYRLRCSELSSVVVSR